MNQLNLYPSLLTASIEAYQHQLDLVLASGVIETIQVDVVDGNFADNLTLTPIDLIGVDHDNLKIDFHLMTQEPMNDVRELVEFKDQLPVRAVIAQVERMSSQLEYVQELQAQNWQVGLALDLYTPVEAIAVSIWAQLDIIQLMTIEAGFQGQKFHPGVLDKIAEIKKLAKKDIEVIIDGGVKKSHLSLLVERQVGGVVVGSGIWQAVDPVTAMRAYF